MRRVYLTSYPNVLKEWDAVKNVGIKAEDIYRNYPDPVWWRCNHGHSWQAKAAGRLCEKPTGCPYCAGQRAIPGRTDIATLAPELLSLWDFEKNQNISPQDLMPYSGMKVWWKCEKGHSWESPPKYISAHAGNCPVCCNHLVLAGYNDLASSDVDFLDEWDCEKNKDIKPSEVTRCSGKKVWWKCPEGHSFRASISGRSQGNGCPYCAHKITVKGETDLASVCPEAAEKWDYKKNYPILPQDVFPHTTNKYYWKCEKGHSWKCRPLFMINDNRCPSCHSRHIKYGQNDFASKYPELLKEWCYDLNQDINPCMLKSTSREKVWWECQNHHKWKATVVGRTTGHGCPMCSGHKVIPGENDLATRCQDAIGLWDYKRNGDKTPWTVKYGSDKKVWWKCEKNHSWEATILYIYQGKRCPYCRNRRAWTGYNDLKTNYPNLMEEWDYARNGALMPEHCLPHSKRKVWWKCSENHTYQSSICHRTRGNGCPYCSGSKVLTGVNDLASVNRRVASLWDHEKNGDMIPENVAAYSNTFAYWKCEKGHTWEAKVYSMANGGGCPYCNNKPHRKTYFIS